MTRKDRNLKFNQRLGHEQKIKDMNKMNKNKNKSAFNRSARPKKMDKKRPGKNKRSSMRNKRS